MNTYLRNVLSAFLLLGAILLIPSSAIAASAADTPAEIKADGSGWSLKFSDDFSGSKLDSSNWDALRYDYWLTGSPKGTASSMSYSNLENSSYSSSLDTVTGGNLVQTVRGGKTGSVNTLRKFDFTYGYVEARISVPDCTGCWPAFWLLGSTPGPPAQAWPPEVDIFEFFPNIAGGHPIFNSHWRDDAGNLQDLHSISGGWAGPTTDNDDYTGTFHTYGFLWTKDNIQGFIDGVPGKKWTGDAVPHDPMYLIETLQTANGYSTPDGSKMLTHYVRVYQ